MYSGHRGGLLEACFAYSCHAASSGVKVVEVPIGASRIMSRFVIGCAVVLVAILLTGCTESQNPVDNTPPGPAGTTETTVVSEPLVVELPTLPSGEFFAPDDAGLVDVREEYGAVGDGVTDDTAAIRRAIRENVGRGRVLFFPAGTYVVSGSLEWRDEVGDWQPWLTFQGQGRDVTVIKLADGADGFGDSSRPRGVVVTASGLFKGSDPTAGGKDYVGKGEGAEAFKNYVFDLTVDTGRDNPGAVGIDFLANNSGSVGNVTIRSGDGRGVAGLSMTRKYPGPALIKNVRVEGFDYGVKTQHTEYGMTFEHLVLADQRVAGIHNSGNSLAIRGLTSRNRVPAVQNVSSLGLVALVDADLGGGSSGVSAIENEGHLYLRDVQAQGYESAVEGRDGGSVFEYATSSVTSGPVSSLGLPIEETPVPVWDDLDDWASVSDPGYGGGADPFDREDDTAAIQAALNSGKSTVYFPSAGQPWEGRYLVSDTLVVPPSVNRIIGFESYLTPNHGSKFRDPSNPRALFRVEGGQSGQVVSLERFRFGRTSAEAPGVIWIEHSSPRTLVVKHVILGGGDHTGLRGLPGSGRLFLEDYCCSNITLNDTGGLWARQLNIERSSLKLRNQSSDLWILGIKTEGPSSVIETSGGARTELIGGLLYPVREVPADTPAFINNNSKHSLIYAVSAYSDDNNYTIQIQEQQNGQTQQILSDEIPDRELGSTVPLYEG